GGSGEEISRNNAQNADGTLTDLTRHAKDADTIVGDNGDIIRIVGINSIDVNLGTTTVPVVTANGSPAYLGFNYDNYGATKTLIVHGVRLLDYTAGGPDYNPTLFSETPVAGMRNEFGIYAVKDIGGHDEVHGETGDDIIYLGGGNDIAYGDAENDDTIGGWGADWISGGTGADGILGDDGRIFTSRNSLSADKYLADGKTLNPNYTARLGEPLYGVALIAKPSDTDLKNINGDALNEIIYTPGNVQISVINPSGMLKKEVDLTPWNLDAGETQGAYLNPSTVVPQYANDVIFGGLGSDWLHGGSGDDAISGAEALSVSYTQTYSDTTNVLTGVARSDWTRPYNSGDMLRFNVDDPTGWHRDRSRRSGEFALYDEYDPLRKLELILTSGITGEIGTAYKDQNELGGFVTTGEWFLNFNAYYGPDAGATGEGVFRASGITPDGVPYSATFDDGADRLFGDLGNDWIVGGTGRDTSYGGFGNDLINDDDYLNTETDERNNKDAIDSPYDNQGPDTQPYYEDRAYGGAGRDVLIGNTGGDRLIDWVGEFNTFLVPFSPYGTASVSRTLQPQLSEFLYALT
ncbi:MAG: hypothetical protein H6Q33_5555, partial [Deltaproteobacteria bacterium]|nr:hypothetical protein [Deltaproteobacteria bacterium]